jgi:hypothetical protein
MEKSRLLEVDSYSLEDLHITESSAADDQDEKFLPDVDFRAFTHATAADRFAVSLSVSGQHGALTFSVRIVGQFTVAEPFVDGKLPSERAINALTILYGVARGYIGTATGWFDDSIIIPTVYFADLVAAKIAAAKEHVIEDSENRMLEAAKSA